MLRRQSRAPRSLSDIEFGDLIGKGVFGKVYVGHNKSTGETLAVKEVSGRTLKNKLDFLKEASVLRKVRHPNLLRLRAIFVVEHEATDEDLRLPAPRKSRTTRWIATLRQKALVDGVTTVGSYSELNSSTLDDDDDDDDIEDDDDGHGDSDDDGNEDAYLDTSDCDAIKGGRSKSSKAKARANAKALEDDRIAEGEERMPPVRVAYKLYLVTEYCNGSSLNKILANKSIKLPWETRLRWISQAASGLQYLHRQGVIHRDLKADNCLLRVGEDPGDDSLSHYDLVLADFGLSRFYRTSFIGTKSARKPMTVVGTPWLMAPELMNPKFQDGYSIESEIFTFGVLMLEVVTRRKALDIPRNPHTLAIDMHSVQEMTVESSAEELGADGDAEGTRSDCDPDESFFDGADDFADADNEDEYVATSSRRSRGTISNAKSAPRASSTRIQSVLQSCPPLLLQLAADCVSLDPKKRPSLPDILTRLEILTENLPRSRVA